MKAKSELLNILYEYKARSENELQVRGCRITYIRLNGFEENLSNPAKEFFRTHGVNLEPSPSCAKQITVAAERVTQVHWTRARVMLLACNLPHNL